MDDSFEKIKKQKQIFFVINKNKNKNVNTFSVNIINFIYTSHLP